jgi:hypothetical protein
MYEKLIKDLNNSFVLTGSEVFYIHNVHKIASTYFFSHSYNYSEINLIVDADCYYVENKLCSKQPVFNISLTVDQFETIPATKENVVPLLVDNCALIRSVAQDFFSQVA